MKIECRGVLFDSDGVLVDSHAQVVHAWSQLADEFGLDIDVLMPGLVGVRAIDTLGRHLSPARAALAVERIEDLEVATASSTRSLTGAQELLKALPSGCWTIVTSASRRLGLARWKGAGIQAPARAVTADDVTEGKPHPEPFRTGAEYLGLTASECVVFEDSASGATAALAAGATVIAVGDQPWPQQPIARVKDLSNVSVTSNGTGLCLELDEGVG